MWCRARSTTRCTVPRQGHQLSSSWSQYAWCTAQAVGNFQCECPFTLLHHYRTELMRTLQFSDYFVEALATRLSAAKRDGHILLARVLLLHTRCCARCGHQSPQLVLSMA
jgi:hypothetical protein